MINGNNVVAVPYPTNQEARGCVRRLPELLIDRAKGPASGLHRNVDWTTHYRRSPPIHRPSRF